MCTIGSKVDVYDKTLRSQKQAKNLADSSFERTQTSKSVIHIAWVILYHDVPSYTLESSGIFSSPSHHILHANRIFTMFGGRHSHHNSHTVKQVFDNRVFKEGSGSLLSPMTKKADREGLASRRTDPVFNQPGADSGATTITVKPGRPPSNLQFHTFPCSYEACAFT